MAPSSDAGSVRVVALLLRHLVPPLEDGELKCILRCGQWRDDEAARADDPIFGQTEIRRHEEAVPMEVPRLIDSEVAASPVRSARATTDFVLVCGGGGSEQAERRRAASGGGMEVGMDRVGAHRPHLYNAKAKGWRVARRAASGPMGGGASVPGLAQRWR